LIVIEDSRFVGVIYFHALPSPGSERVKRSGVVGKELKEAANINGGLLVLGNVIVALSSEADGKKKGHVPYRSASYEQLLSPRTDLMTAMMMNLL
jgi:hypothetical protein